MKNAILMCIIALIPVEGLSAVDTDFVGIQGATEVRVSFATPLSSISIGDSNSVGLTLADRFRDDADHGTIDLRRSAQVFFDRRNKNFTEYRVGLGYEAGPKGHQGLGFVSNQFGVIECTSLNKNVGSPFCIGAGVEQKVNFRSYESGDAGQTFSVNPYLRAGFGF